MNIHSSKRIRYQKIGRIGLVALFLFLNGPLYAQAAMHSLQHYHHNATTHSTPICTWLCTAGQTVEFETVSLDHFSSTLGPVEFLIPILPLSLFIGQPSSRGPPASSFFTTI